MEREPMTDIYQIRHKVKNRLEREIKEHSVPILPLNDNWSQHEIHDDGIITGRLALAKELLNIISKPIERKKDKWTPTIEKNIPIWTNKSNVKYYFLIEMEVGDSIHFESKKQLWKILSTITNWKNRNKKFQFYEIMQDRKFSYRTMKDKSYRLWRVK